MKNTPAIKEIPTENPLDDGIQNPGKTLPDEKRLKPNVLYEKGQWKKIATHDEKVVKGFFGEYRFLSNFWPAKVYLDDEEYQSVENAYQAAKYKKERRKYLIRCTAREAAEFSKSNPLETYTEEGWAEAKLEVMRKLLEQKFDKNLNPENHEKLVSTGERYLEETNYWEDRYWGVHKTHAREKGEGQNNLGKLLMEIRGY